MKFGYSKNRPALLLAPDAVLIINQDLTLPVCKACGASSNIVDLVTRLSVNAGIESTPSTATFDLVVPKHSSSQVYEQGKLNLPLLSEVEILIKGRFLVGNEPQYYRVFWGLIMNVDYTYSDGAYTIHVSCDDMLRWWDISKVITQDSTLNAVYTSQPFRALSNVYSNLRPNEIIYALSVAMFEDNLAVLSANLSNPDFASRTYANASLVYENALAYWKKRFASIASTGSLKIFNLTDGDIQAANNNKLPQDASELQKRLWGIKQAILGKDVQKLFESITRNSDSSLDSKILKGSLPANNVLDTTPLFTEFSGSFDSTQLGTKSPLEIANEVAQMIDFEFFMDTGGTITFKPPLYNMETKDQPESEYFMVRDTDVISYTITHNYEHVYTRIDVKGSFTQDPGQQAAPSTFYIDPLKVKQYGVRQVEKSFNFIKDPKLLRFKAIHELNRINSREYTATITIAGRPEVRLGTPIFLECENIYAYVIGVTHEFDFGQSYTTTLSVSNIRRSGIVDGKKPDTYVEIKKLDYPQAIDRYLRPKLKTLQGNQDKVKALLEALLEASGKKLDSKTSSAIDALPSYLDALKKAATLVTSQDIQVYIKNSNQNPNTPNPLLTVAEDLKQVSNFIKASELNFEQQPINTIPDPMPQGTAYFRRYDKDGFELVFGMPYGSSYLKDYLRQFPNKPVDIVSAVPRSNAKNNRTATPTSCKCDT